MKYLISGSKGLIGAAISSHVTQAGHTVMPIVRGDNHGVKWDALDFTFEDPEALNGYGVVIHLAGEPIVGRWSQEKKQRILNSRVNSTSALAHGLSLCREKPQMLLVASAIGFYGHREAEELTEESARGNGFLSDVCQKWEEAAIPAKNAGIRVVHLRFGIILSKEGGALKKMLPAFRMGLGGRIGDGQQHMSWITLEDAVGAISHIIEHDHVTGPVNIVAPNPVTNQEFTKALGTALHRPVILPLPAVAARAILGEAADALLLSSQRVMPRNLLDGGFQFKHSQIEDAFRNLGL